MNQSSERQVPMIVAQPQRERAGHGPRARRIDPAARLAPDATLFEAHMLGQTGRRHGLKAGPPHLEAARNAYLSIQWSGDNDRRLTPGLLRRDTI